MAELTNDIPEQAQVNSNNKTQALLSCPIRGLLNVTALAKDGLTVTEEARRIDFINFLLTRKYPEQNIAVEIYPF